MNLVISIQVTIRVIKATIVDIIIRMIIDVVAMIFRAIMIDHQTVTTTDVKAAS